MTVSFLLLVILALLLIILWLLWDRNARYGGAGSASSAPPASSSGSGPAPPGSPSAPAPTIPDQIAGAGIASLLQPRLAGVPADGSTPPSTIPTSVIWVDQGDEVLVHLDSTTTQIVGQNILVSIDLETDQTGRTPLVVAFAVGTDATGGLIAATDEFPRGSGVLTGRWGPAVQTAAWSALLSIASDHATERGLAPRALAVTAGELQLIAGPPLSIA
jgi:hypothetical protein